MVPVGYPCHALIIMELVVLLRVLGIVEVDKTVVVESPLEALLELVQLVVYSVVTISFKLFTNEVM
jgi:hypothetical protein